jgi:hypothetical protein
MSMRPRPEERRPMSALTRIVDSPEAIAVRGGKTTVTEIG